MPRPEYINTPQTATDYSSLNGLGELDDISPEKSFVSPSKGHGLLKGMRNGRRVSLKTPRAGGRDPLRLLPNGAAPKAEFTPLMMSVTKKNHLPKTSMQKPGLKSPYLMKDDSMINGNTPNLPRASDSSRLDDERTSSSAGDVADEPPLPQTADDSFQSTALPHLPARDGRGAIVGDGNMMTLREQENIIDKIDKENFGLKLKVHYLEQCMAQRGPEINQAALKENTDLKVNRVTMQRELHKFRKNISQAERDAEVYRLQLEEYQQRMQRRQADESVRIETERLQSEVKTKDSEIVHLHRELESARQSDSESQKLRAEISDLDAEIREKDRTIEEREDEIDNLKENGAQDSNTVAELEDELDAARRQIDELQKNLDQAGSASSLARQEREDALEAKKQMENDLEELRDEMMNKSFTTKGLSRQLEEKITKLENEVEDLQEKHITKQHELDHKAQNEQLLQERLLESEREGSIKGNLENQLDLAKRNQDGLNAELETMATELQNAQDDLQCQSEEKDLLQSRHDALTSESASLQQDLAKAQKSVKTLEQALDEERQHATQNDHYLRSQHKTEVDMLTEQVDSLHRAINAKTSEQASERENWEAQRRRLDSTSQEAEERANGLQRTVNKLQEAEGTLSGREMNLQAAFNSEKEMQQQEEQVLNRQIQELHDEIAAKRKASNEQRAELDNAREELRISIREQAALQKQVQLLEEEVEVLQGSLEEEEKADKQRYQGVDDLDTQLREITKEKQNLQDQLGTVNVQLHQLKDTGQDVQNERDELEARLLKMEKEADGTFNVDHEKRDLRRLKQKLEKEVERLGAERNALQEGNLALEEEVKAEIERANAEENRLNLELDNLRNKRLSTSDTRDRELVSAKNKVQRLEKRVGELEELVENQTRNMPSQGIEDVSALRSDLAEARTREAATLQRESTLKSTSRDLKSQVARLQGEVHEMQMAKLNMSSRSPSSSPATAKELAKARKDLLDAQATLRDLRIRNRELEHQASTASVDKAERADLHALVKSSTLEAEALSLKVSDRDMKITDIKAQLKRLRSERDKAHAQAQAANEELDALQDRHESVLKRVQHRQESSVDAAVQQKELRGLMKEVVWLRARCRREAGFRRDLAWSKGFMEMGEGIRAACNQADLRMIQEMGVTATPRSSYESKLAARQRLRAAVHVVLAANRMKILEREWRDLRKMGEGLKRSKEG